ncbi:MAG: Flp pilus assembly protein CpaB [Myxococcales bacterium]|nr:Flp pilus assembly protein CpaB [Myxococcales bacterium]
MTRLALAASLILAAVVTAAVSSHLTGLDDALRAAFAREPPKTLLVAARTLPVGHVIVEEDLREQPVPAWVPDGVLGELGHIEGRTVASRILSGELIRVGRLSERGVAPGLSAIIPPGSRALSIHLQDADAMDALLEPEDHVDVLVTIFGDDGHAAETTRVVELARVLAVDGRMAGGQLGQPTRKAQVTLLMTEQEAQRLALALNVGLPRLVMRAERDGGRAL